LYYKPCSSVGCFELYPITYDQSIYFPLDSLITLILPLTRSKYESNRGRWERKENFVVINSYMVQLYLVM